MGTQKRARLDMEIPKHILCIPAFLSTVALLLSFNGFRCDFVEFDFSNGQDGPNFGYWSRQSWTVNNSTNGLELESGCKDYPYDVSPPDTAFKVGRAFNLLALILGASFLFLDILTGCASANQKRSVRQAGGVGYLVVSFCSGMSLLILQSDVCTDNDINNELKGLQGTCKLSRGGKSVIAATCLWFVASCGIIAMHPWQSKKKGSVHDDPSVEESLVDPMIGGYQKYNEEQTEPTTFL